MRDVLLIVVAVALVHWFAADHAPFGSTTRYTEASREMVELDDWVVPHLAYAPYGEKPVLVYWLGAASQKLFGESWRARQLPGALATLVTLLATYLLGAAWRGAAFGLASAFGLLATSMFLATASVLSPDPLLTAFLAVAWLAAFKVVDGTALDGFVSRGARWWSAVLWLAIALGALTKGPVALIVPGLAIAAYALATGGFVEVARMLWRLRPLEGLLIVALVNGPWTWLAWQRDPRLVEFFYLDINFRSFANGSFNHPAPWHYYFGVVVLMLLPFAPVALPLIGAQLWDAARLTVGLRSGRRDGATLDRDDRARLLLAAIVLVPFLFFSASVSKLGTYLMPLLPAMVLLAADRIASWRSAPRWASLTSGATALLLLLVVVAAPFLVVWVHSQLRAGRTPSLGHFHFRAGDLDFAQFGTSGVALLLLAVAAAAVLLVRATWSGLKRGTLNRSLFELGLAVALLVVGLEPRANALIVDLDATRLADVVKSNAGPRDEVVVFDAAVQHYEFVERLRRPVAIWGKAREVGLGLFLQATNPAFRVVAAPRRPPKDGLPPLPGPGQPIDDPYRVSGENTPGHPWLWSNARLKSEWNGERRIWLLVDYDRLRDRSDGEQELRDLGLAPQRVDASRDYMLLSNRR
jgi:4-amino-4-deoxy-L-arabinose transferase-like glycosyltransferase